MDACVSPGMVARTIHEGGSSDILDKIHSPGCAAAIWQRRLAPELQERLDTIEPQFLPEARIELEADRVAEAMDVVFGGCGLTRSDALRTMLTADVVGIARLFARIVGTTSLRLRLDVVDDNACTKFHQDNVPVRLLCSYRGRGTEYGLCRQGEIPSTIHDMARGAVALFRGQLWPSSETIGLAHRSPQILGLGETRLMLVIDPLGEIASKRM
ncbi:DUF1826 domain-containing protein [Breoghania sp.]|uniref:DUF1826 domain-containing protein n=1 Tax=Breoghania sp. TaxID=2065378 RepID=UPI002AA8CA43|nr:DUF1826 domain-containing protein [Breoghania sp.]